MTWSGVCFFFQAEDGIRDLTVTGVQTCALPSPALGLKVDFIDADTPASWQSNLRPETRAIYVETMSNPLLQVGDLEAIVAFARSHGLVSIVDNTFASPGNFRPPEHRSEERRVGKEGRS